MNDETPSNRQALAQMAHARKRPNKADAQETLRALADQYPEALPDLAGLYAYFMPTKSKTAKTAFDWVAQAAAVKDCREYLNFVYVTAEGDMVATDGHRLHRAPAPASLLPGYYDPRNGDWVHGPDFAKYPDYARVLADAEKGASTLYLEDPLTVGETDLGHPVYLLRPDGDRAAFQIKYLDAALAGMPTPAARLRDSKCPVVLRDGDRLAVVMPIQL